MSADTHDGPHLLRAPDSVRVAVVHGQTFGASSRAEDGFAFFFVDRRHVRPKHFSLGQLASGAWQLRVMPEPGTVVTLDGRRLEAGALGNVFEGSEIVICGHILKCCGFPRPTRRDVILLVVEDNDASVLRIPHSAEIAGHLRTLRELNFQRSNLQRGSGKDSESGVFYHIKVDTSLGAAALCSLAPSAKPSSLGYFFGFVGLSRHLAYAEQAKSRRRQQASAFSGAANRAASSGLAGSPAAASSAELRRGGGGRKRKRGKRSPAKQAASEAKKMRLSQQRRERCSSSASARRVERRVLSLECELGDRERHDRELARRAADAALRQARPLLSQMGRDAHHHVRQAQQQGRRFFVGAARQARREATNVARRGAQHQRHLSAHRGAQGRAPGDGRRRRDAAGSGDRRSGGGAGTAGARA